MLKLLLPPVILRILCALFCGENIKPVLTETHFFAGRAYEELGNAAESQRHFHVAAGVDPIGHYDRLALSVLMGVAR